MNNIILLATYWNESEWIEASLEQIIKIDPIEIIICDGNFDPRVPNYSTDGTREIIKEFVDNNKERASMIDAVRVNKWIKGFHFFMSAGLSGKIPPFSRLNYSLRSQLIINEYRVNQALTFAKMINLSKQWSPGKWVMSYDADQFYTDELIENFQMTNELCKYDLITADELTFPENFDHYTMLYEKRKWNNMPHKITDRIAVYPTRHFVNEKAFSFSHIHETACSYHAGVYHHYKFREDSQRLQASYNLGDRKPPDPDRFSGLKEFKGDYPNVIKDMRLKKDDRSLKD